MKPGTFAQAEKLLKEKLPGCGLRASPHIESRVKTLERQYNAMTEMLTHGDGFSSDEKNTMVHCNTDVYEKWDHKDANGLRLETFPHYEDFKLILRKDHACKKEIIAPIPVTRELHQQEETANINVGVEIVEADVSVAQPSSTSASSSTEGSAQSCRKRSRECADLTEVMVRTCNALERLDLVWFAKKERKEEGIKCWVSWSSFQVGHNEIK